MKIVPVVYAVILGGRLVESRLQGGAPSLNPDTADFFVNYAQQDDDDDEEHVNVLVGVKNDDGETKVSNKAKQFRNKLKKRINVVSAKVKKSELAELRDDPDIDFVELDALYYPDSEAILYGLEMIQALSPVLPKYSDSVSASCNDPDSFKIGIIDSGLAVNHPEVACYNVGQEDSNCVGAEFGLSANDGKWYEPVKRYHGTHVFGTIGASGENNSGLQGVIGDNKICYIIARVFGESGGGSSMSYIFEAVDWVVEMGAKVVNMSIGGAEVSTTGQLSMQSAYQAGALLIAAAGNAGSSDLHFPASYNNVVSVAAVDPLKNRATFSNYNSGIDIAAPGTDILSLYPPGTGGAVLMRTNGVGAPGKYMRLSAELLGTAISGELIDCGYGGTQCPTGSAGSGHICLIERGGGLKFAQKASSCQASGGVAAIIFNNDAGLISGGLTEDSYIRIPVFEIAQIAGQQLLGEAGTTIEILEKTGYGYASGTSMAAPHVTGVAAKIWRMCPLCKNIDVESCLFSSAEDLGAAGKDIYFGYGLLQADNAYFCLRDERKCCGESTSYVSPSAIESPSQTPALTPSQSISPTLSSSRTDVTPIPSESMISSMYWFEFYKNNYLSGAYDLGTFSQKLATVAATDIEFDSIFSPVNETLKPLFQQRQGVDNVLARYVYEREIAAITTTNDLASISATSADRTISYHQSHSGSFGDGNLVSFETNQKLTYNNDGKISRILMSIVDTQPIDQAYPTDM